MAKKSYRIPGTKYKVSQHDLIVGGIGGAAVGVIALLMWPKGPAGFSGMTRGYGPPGGFLSSAVHPPVIPHNPLQNGGSSNWLTPQVDYNGDSTTYFSRGYYERNPAHNPALSNPVPVFNAAYNGYPPKYAPPIPAPVPGVYYPGDGRVFPTKATPIGGKTF